MKPVDVAVKYLRSVLHHSGLSYQFWTYAITCWIEIRNRILLASNSVDIEERVGESP